MEDAATVTPDTFEEDRESSNTDVVGAERDETAAAGIEQAGETSGEASRGQMTVHRNHPWIVTPSGWVLTADPRQWITGRPDSPFNRRVRNAYYHISLENAANTLWERMNRETAVRSLEELIHVVRTNRTLVLNAVERAVEEIPTGRAEELSEHDAL